MRILIVDDDHLYLMYTKMYLKKTGVDIVTESKPEQALILVKNDTFDLVVTDLNMPGMTGLQLLLEIRKINQHIPVILQSGLLDDASIDEAKNNGVHALYTKPAGNELIDEINSMRNTKKLVVNYN